ncbi:hypothetical protein P5V15_015411 [Pogonomyrmex californicus]
MGGDPTVRIGRPVRKFDFRISEFDRSVSAAEVAGQIAAVGGCDAADIRTGQPRFMSGGSGLGTIWTQCPTAAALRVARCRRVVLGWASARVDLLKGHSDVSGVRPRDTCSRGVRVMLTSAAIIMGRRGTYGRIAAIHPFTLPVT